MNLRNDERKQLIGELVGKKDELGIIDFLRKQPIRYEYLALFEAENEEEAKSRDKNCDIRKFTLRRLQKEYAEKLNIRGGHTELNELKVMIFNEKLLVPVGKNDDKDKLKNLKIKEWKIVFSFFIGLIGNDVCKLQNYQNAIKILGRDNLKQNDFDTDLYYNEHDNVARDILDNYLLPFIYVFLTYLG